MCGVWKVSELEYLSQFSSAVLTPDLNCSYQKIRVGRSGRATQAGGRVTQREIRIRQRWCFEQLKKIGQFGAVLEKGVAA